jgi:pimeloyl-ACP methyl ester carboxylesterase
MNTGADDRKAPIQARDCWTDNRGVRLHYLDTGEGRLSSLVPVVFIPGALGGADLYLREFQSLAPRRCIAISLRGRGKSEAPAEGYTFEDHVADIESVIRDSELNRYCLAAYSMGVPYAIEQAARDQGKVKGLVIGDYAARLPLIRPEWVEQSLTHPGARPEAVKGLQRESREVILWDRLEKITSPVLIIRGGKPGSLLSEENAERYRKHLSDVVIVQFEDSDHAVFMPSYERYIGTIKDFLERLDQQPHSSVRL